ncbi:hypothetical protein [Nocardia sp. NPDC052566]|uniref:hypothetical protein n=1 Tax=Nocardia sp. NPDC052566 TaxID=3364330 RepID=UPI0037C616DB
MTVNNRVQWGVMVGRVIRPLPHARTVADAMIYLCKVDAGASHSKVVVVYRNSDSDMWRTWIGEREQPTQLAFDLPEKGKRP